MPLLFPLKRERKHTVVLLAALFAVKGVRESELLTSPYVFVSVSACLSVCLSVARLPVR